MCKFAKICPVDSQLNFNGAKKSPAVFSNFFVVEQNFIFLQAKFSTNYFGAWNIVKTNPNLVLFKFRSTYFLGQRDVLLTHRVAVT